MAQVYHSGLGFQDPAGQVYVVEFRPDNSNQLVSFLGPSMSSAVAEVTGSSLGMLARKVLSPVASLFGQSAARALSGGMASFVPPSEYTWENPGSVHMGTYQRGGFNATDWASNMAIGTVTGAVVNELVQWAGGEYNRTFTTFQPMAIPTTRTVGARACHDFTESALEHLADVHGFAPAPHKDTAPPLRDVLLLHAHEAIDLGVPGEISNSDAEAMLQHVLPPTRWRRAG